MSRGAQKLWHMKHKQEADKGEEWLIKDDAQIAGEFYMMLRTRPRNAEDIP